MAGDPDIEAIGVARVTAAGEPAGLADTVAAAVLQTDLGQYSSMLTQLGTEFYAEQQALALSGVQRFARNLQNCGTLSIGETAGDDTGCLWARYDNNPSSRESRAGFPAMSDESYSISSGVQVPRFMDVLRPMVSEAQMARIGEALGPIASAA